MVTQKDAITSKLGGSGSPSTSGACGTWTSLVPSTSSGNRTVQEGGLEMPSASKLTLEVIPTGEDFWDEDMAAVEVCAC
jgi:hypothetical protein